MSRSRYNHSSKGSSFSTSTTSIGGKSKVYSIYVSTRVWNSTHPAPVKSKTHSLIYTTSETTRTSTESYKTTMINGTPCTTLSYYEPTCACTQTTVVPVAYTPGPSFEAARLVTVSGVPCTTTQYWEPTCDCIQTSTIPISAVIATASIHTVINEVPYVTSKYFEPACNCVQSATVPVRIASAEEGSESTAQAACSEAPNTLSMCIAACMHPEGSKTTMSPQ
ncbi:uncharacterized protein M421DRAFT_247232 [Didymella exigua CBS 183.55]|uniref:Uncharacterized protein n=1 Tax=Didymella exigua CBS 183.55 TaxID=1150837 RepID=A0A6A5RY06_9PLEO|nr:uncharacterized protein M421DRAFT_247232 [Didymella exigua CBS 183.55]KAF1932712.1 hypothetical protein M421DRAFT_247232 [Didymella exigua CBS 183.55]